MGGKRPDQYRIDPAEAGATDYKFRPKDKKEAKAQDRLYSEVMEGRTKKGQPIPPDVRTKKARRQRQDAARDDNHEGDESRGDGE